MKRQKKKYILWGLCLILTILSIHCYSINEVKYQEVARGVVESKTKYPYGCGKHGSSTCYDNIFVINQKEVMVTSDTFKNYREGSYVTLREKVDNVNMKIYVCSLMFAWWGIFATLGFLKVFKEK